MLRWVLRLTLVLGGGFGAFILSALIQLRVGRADCPDLPGVDQICVGPTPEPCAHGSFGGNRLEPRLDGDSAVNAKD